MLPRLSLDKPTVAVCPLAVFGGPDDAFDLPPPPQPATASAASRSTAPPARKVMDLLRVMSKRLLSIRRSLTKNSLVPGPRRDIAGTGRSGVAVNGRPRIPAGGYWR